MENWNNFFKKCHNRNRWHRTLAGDAVAKVVTSATQLNIDPAFGDAIYQETTSRTLCYFLQDAYEGTVALNNRTNIQMTLTFFSSVFGGGQDKYFHLSTMNRFRIVQTLYNVNTAFQIDESSTSKKQHTVSKIQLFSPTWSMWIQQSTEVLLMHPEEKIDTFDSIIRVRESFLKALYFTHVCTSLEGVLSASSAFIHLTTFYQLFVGCCCSNKTIGLPL